MNIIGIYKVTNLINGKVYIGQSIDIRKRWRQHKNAAKSKEKSLFYSAIRKYGIENFSFEIIEECSLEELDDKEKFYIEKFNSYIGWENSNGYNMTTGGNRPNALPMSYSNRIKMSRKKNGEPVVQLDMNGNYIRMFEAISIAAKELNVSPSSIRANISGKAKSCRNFIFIKLSDYFEHIDYSVKREKIPRPIVQLTWDGKFVKEYENQKVAAEETGICNVSISACCLNKGRLAGGYQWLFKEDYSSQKVSIKVPHMKKVKQFSLDKILLNIFDSIKEASIKTGVSVSGIIRSCTKERKTAGGFIWEYAENYNQ